MHASVKMDNDYRGFEQGPIRPPSEAGSLLIRITRNCPWNRCTFCPVYKGSAFSLRPVDHVLEDIDRVHRYVLEIRACVARKGKVAQADVDRLRLLDGKGDHAALNAALNWARAGMESIFLQDANSLIIKPEQLLAILHHLQHCFPWIKRITSYARSHTVARISDQDLQRMAAAGLSRIHIGMETGSDKVLARIKKGVDKTTHIKAGQKIKQAGMELSEYIMPGLGGRDLSMEHALESADALNQINPDFIRLRTLAIPNHVELYDDYSSGDFQKLGDVETARELLVFFEALTGITSTIKSDHILNLFENLEGQYPQDKEKMVGIITQFLELDPTEQMYYQVGRRIGLFKSLEDLQSASKRHQVEDACARAGIRPDNVDEAIDQLMKRFI
ncbi:radical SAM protein [Desulfopila sp. IMCC35006]|uniref:radical SAM protein n=1 Tax=Desulfopila sp. IMCC35006 TaxID=2569542 RepID=UPI00197AA051|nr:radical SAM protein [Desulfopila sp. IMCC35006]